MVWFGLVLKASQIETLIFSVSKYQFTKAEYTTNTAKIGTQCQLRVKVENAVGVSEPSEPSDAVTIYGKVKHVCSLSYTKMFTRFSF